jgi:pilus assembly protein CpaC
MSGETANFLAGGEFPIPIPQGNGTISITFKSYGISLSFTPTLLSGNRVSLHVRPEVSELTDTGAIVISSVTVPALTTRKAETTVEVTSGESFAMAGLLSNNQAQTVNKFPLLGDLPVLGSLFRSERYLNGQTELVVIITPYIVRPSGEKLALPTDGLVPPSELDRLAKQRFTGSVPTGRPISGEPEVVIATPVMAAPAIEPTAPAPDAAPLAPVDVSPVQPAPLSSPLVLHPKGEDRNSGLMVE